MTKILTPTWGRIALVLPHPGEKRGHPIFPSPNFRGEGSPLLWEEGGGYTNTGEATVVASPDGGPLRPLWVERRGPLANQPHAGFYPRVGLIVVVAERHRDHFSATLGRVVEKKGEEVTLNLLLQMEVVLFREEWDNLRELLREELPELDLPRGVADPIVIALQKTECYHCREPHWVRP